AVREAPTPEERAALLGLDYAQLARTSARLNRWSIGVTVVAALTVLIPLVFGSASTSWGDWEYVGVVAGAVAVALMFGVAMIAALLGAVALSRVVGRQRPGLVGLALLTVLVVVGLYLSVVLTAGTPLSSGVV